MFDAQPFTSQPEDELRYLKIVVAALRRLAVKESRRSPAIVDLALSLEEHYGEVGASPKPSREDFERAAATCWQHINHFSEAIDGQADTELMGTLITFNIGPDYASKPWLKEPFEFHPPIDPAEHPRELAWHLEMLQRRTILEALISALDSPPPSPGLC